MDINDLKKNKDKANESQKAAIKFLIDCLYVYQQGNDDALGYMGCVLAKSFSQEDSSAPCGWKPNKRYTGLIKRVREAKNVNCVLSTMGATWEKDYKDINVDDYEPKWTKETMDGEQTRIFINAGGRDIDFPVNVQQNNKGQWKIMGGLSTMCMDVRKPKSAVGDF